MTESRQRILLRAADRIHDELDWLANLPDAWLPDARWEECCGLLRRIQMADLHDWQGAGRRLRVRLEAALRSLGQQVHEAAGSLSPVLWPRKVPSQHQLYEELRALHDEFGDVECDFTNKVLAVVTEPIVLEGIDLGPFEIRLDWGKLGDASPYAVSAQEPFRAGSNESVTHPHVQDDSLCEGDGRKPIEAALREGRLFDFFTIVTQILKTYNPDSAYVALSSWTREPCVDCDCTLGEDDLCRCDRCGESLCTECVIGCQGCEDTFCGQCISRCQGCEEPCCGRCLEACPDCSRRFCGDCRFEDQKCEECHAASQAQLERPDTSLAGGPVADRLQAEEMEAATRPAEADPAAEPVRLGQAVVSA